MTRRSLPAWLLMAVMALASIPAAANAQSVFQRRTDAVQRTVPNRTLNAYRGFSGYNNRVYQQAPRFSRMSHRPFWTWRRDGRRW